MAQRQALVKNGASFKEGKAFFSANPKEVPKGCFNRKTLVAAHEQGRLATEQELQRNGKLPPEKLFGSGETGYSQAPTSANSLPISSLKEIFLPQLELDKRHHGRVLFGTFCVQPFKMSLSVMSVLADKSGKAVRLSIHNLPVFLSGQKEIEARFAPGQKIAIKEPSFKLCSDGKVTICIDNAADLILVDDSNEQIVFELDAVLEELGGIRVEGNRMFAQQKWKDAIELYSRCIVRGSAVAGGGEIGMISPCLLLAFSNRSEAWLRLFDYKNALDDANKALEFDPMHQKSIWRRDRASQGFGKMPTSKLKVPVEATVVVEQPMKAEKGVASKIKSKDVTQPAATAPKAKSSKRNPLSSNGTSGGNGSDSKPVSPPFTPPKRAAEDSKNKSGASPNPKDKGAESKNLFVARDTSTSKVGATDRKSTSPTPKAGAVPKPKDKGAESKNLFVARDTSTSKVGATDRKSTSPTPRASTVEVVQSRDKSSALGTSTTGKHSNVTAAQASAAKWKLAPSDEEKVAAAARHLWNLSSDSEIDSSPEKSAVKRTDGDEDIDDDVDERLVTERTPTDAERRDSRYPDADVTSFSTMEPQKGMAGAIDIELPSFAAWLDSIRSSADVLLSQGNWADAVKIYNRVTGFPLPQKNRGKVIQTLLMAYSHRSEAWIWMGDFEKSLRDAHSAIKIADNYPQSVVGFEGKHLLNEVRRGRAFHGLGEYEKACGVFQHSLAKSPNDKSIVDLLKKSKVALEQSQNGIYDLDEYFGNGCRGPPPPCSDFVGPVEIRRVLGKGRGLFVTKDVEAGDLLLATNPLVVVRRRLNADDDDEDYSQVTTKWRRSNSRDSPVGLNDFVKRLSRLRTEQQICQLYTLTGGIPEDETEIPNMNLFSPGPHFSVPQGFESYASSERDLHTLQRRAMLNAIEGGLNPLDGANYPDKDKDEAITCVGVWALPSFMNHSCVPNCHMIDVGNTMFVRASRYIQEGEELTRAYFDVYRNSLDRQELCAEWNFECNCERCTLEKSLADQKILPLHEYRSLLERVQEESLKRSERERSISVLLPNPQPALLQLRKFADWCDSLLYRAAGLENKEKAWIGASHLEAYVSRFHGSMDRNQFILGLENLLEFMTNTAILAVGCTSESALERAAVLLRLVEEAYGHGSQTFQRIETRVLELYHTVYGGLNKEVLYTMSRLMIRSD